MASTTSTRLWRACKAGGRPWPVLDDDPVIDTMLMEAVGIKVAQEDEEMRQTMEKNEEKKRWKEDKSELMQFAG